MPTSPSVLNYSVLKGYPVFTPDGGSATDLGNCVEFELTPEVDKLDHFSGRAPGIRVKDRSVVREQTLTVRMVLDEITPENLQKALMGDTLAVNTAGNSSFGIFAESEITGSLTFTGTNAVGNQVNLTLPSISFTPSGSLNLISDEWEQIELTAEVLYVAALGDFGECEIIEVASV